MQKYDQVKMEGILAIFPFLQCADSFKFHLVNDVINFVNNNLLSTQAKCPPNQTRKA